MRVLFLLLALFTASVFAGSYTTCPGGECQRTEIDQVNDGGPGMNDNTGSYEVGNGGTTTYYTTTGDKSVHVGGGRLISLYNASGTSITAIVYDNAGATCNTGGIQKTGTMALTNGTPYHLGIDFSSGLCITVAGTSPTLTVVTLP